LQWRSGPRYAVYLADFSVEYLELPH